MIYLIRSLALLFYFIWMIVTVILAIIICIITWNWDISVDDLAHVEEFISDIWTGKL